MIKRFGVSRTRRNRNMALRDILPAKIVAACVRPTAKSGAAMPVRIPTLMLCAIGILSVAAGVRAQTYDPDYPVCMHVYGPVGGYYSCRYTSIAQCAPLAQGRSAECVVNPYYAGGPHKEPPRRPRYRQKPD
jgi:hypothetical protein